MSKKMLKELENVSLNGCKFLIFSKVEYPFLDFSNNGNELIYEAYYPYFPPLMPFSCAFRVDELKHRRDECMQFFICVHAACA